MNGKPSEQEKIEDILIVTVAVISIEGLSLIKRLVIKWWGELIIYQAEIIIEKLLITNGLYIKTIKLMKKFEATYFRREKDWGLVVSTEWKAGDYLTPTTNREELLNNPALAERLYWAVVDWVKEKASQILESEAEWLREIFLEIEKQAVSIKAFSTAWIFRTDHVLEGFEHPNKESKADNLRIAKEHLEKINELINNLKY